MDKSLPNVSANVVLVSLNYKGHNQIANETIEVGFWSLAFNTVKDIPPGERFRIGYFTGLSCKHVRESKR